MQAENYEGREQAFVKHWFLKHYLQKLALKVGQFQPRTTLNYIDGFSGPWDTVNTEAADSSPSIAANELRQASVVLARRPKPVALTVRAMFVEKDPEAFRRLEGLRQLLDIPTEAHHGAFEDHIDDAVRFARTGSRAFAFVFIDPTGWTGYGLRRITPLLRVHPGEVLIHFMTKDIKRFIDNERPGDVASFIDLFGDDYRSAWRGLEDLDREDEIVRTYCRCVKKAGDFKHVVSAVILNPQSDRTHYHLIYATRSDEGLATFRATEAGATRLQRKVRARVRENARLEHKGFAGSLFDADVMDTNYVGALLERYNGRAKAELRSALQQDRTLEYDGAELDALQWPMTSETDVREWVRDWKATGDVVVDGLKGKERTPKRKHGHRLRWTR